MASRNYLTYKQAFRLFAEKGGSAVIPFRKNTKLEGEWVEDNTYFIVKVLLYDTVIAELWDNNVVQLWCEGHQTNTTKNRMNDVLIPIGWNIKSVSGTWKVIPVRNDSRFGSKDFYEGMKISAIMPAHKH